MQAPACKQYAILRTNLAIFRLPQRARHWHIPAGYRERMETK